jgi:site-specific recombinase XerD
MPRHRRQEGLPPHVDATRVPVGIYWDKSGRGRWIMRDPQSGATRRVAGPEATLSELHAIAEEQAGGSARGSVAYVLAQFHNSADFKGLAPRTQSDYERQRIIACGLRTKIGPFGELIAKRLRVPMMQTLLDRIGVDHPTKANHLLRYLRRTFRWGITRGHLDQDPTRAIRQFKERARRRLPEHITIAAVTQFAQARGQRLAHTEGSVAPYLWICIELGYMCRLRPVEVITLTEAAATDHGLRTNRRKGSRDSLVLWTPRLRAAWDAAIELRNATWQRRATPVPMRPQDRLVLVNDAGQAIADSTLQSAWQRLMLAAIAAGVITPEQRFGAHDLKRRGITDTKGRAEKLEAGGHRSEQMLDVYDLEVPAVAPAPGGPSGRSD